MTYKNEVEAVNALSNKFGQLHSEIKKRIYGQDEIIDQVLVALFSRGHCLLIGVPGLAKTLLVNTIAEVLGPKFWIKIVNFDSFADPFSLTLFWLMKLTVLRQKLRRLFLKPCRNERLLRQGRNMCSTNHFLCWPLKIQLNRKELILSPKLSLIGLCSPFGSIIPNLRTN